MKLYSSLTQTVDPFEPTGGIVKIYVCGITPYDTTHLGHAFTYTINDVLIRYLEWLGYPVQYAQNVTDIDDDILRKAREVGEDWQTLGNYWTAHFIEDMQVLNVRPPDFFPRASEFISEIITINEQLVEKGYAYIRDGNVYYQVDKWPEFGKLSHLPLSEMLPIANQRGNRPDDPHKKHPLDFVLWQAQADGEPAWESPWGSGRPGWHIECSAMASQLLGKTIDIHSGGGDLIFPHHECEIAQLEPVTEQEPFVRFWLHVAMVYHQGEKMSKSLGNLVMCRNLLQDWSPDTLRLFLANHHYRKPWSFDLKDLEQADLMVSNLCAAVTAPGGSGASFDADSQVQLFRAAMDEDLNTPLALDMLHQMSDDILQAARQGGNVREAQAHLRQLAKIFGLRLGESQSEQRVVEGWAKHLERFPS